MKINGEAAAVTLSLLAACLQAKHHGSYNIYIGAHLVVSEERRQLRAVFLFFFPSGVGGDVEDCWFSSDRRPENLRNVLLKKSPAWLMMFRSRLEMLH